MNEQKFPQLERLHILRTETLCSIRDRAFDGLQLFLKNFSDGIVSGCELVTTKDTITLTSGIILKNKFLYLLTKPMSVKYSPTDEYVILKIFFAPELLTENFIQRNVEIILSSDLELADNEMEICRFKLKKGAILRTNYTDFFDFATEFDTVNIINVPYAAPLKSTISPEIIYKFAVEAKDYMLTSEDFNFCMLALRGEILSVEQIIFYIERRLKINLRDTSNQSLYDNLKLILQEIQSGRRSEIIGKGRRRKEIIVN